MAVEFFTPEHASVGVANAMADCLGVSQGHKHEPHVHDRWNTGDACCKGFPAVDLFYLPRS